ncbi:hypothetical protein B9T27_01690 [Acinetobacter sp. ANC 4648]|nr:hypothetical protein B9T27_01690 [Acinetobacter sp. ANC 4648]
MRLGGQLQERLVGKNLSNSKGYFKLDKKRYFAFLLIEIWAIEISMLYVQEQVSKAGFQTYFLT